MTTIKEAAQAYEPPQILSIAELDKVSVDLELVSVTYKEGTADEFTVWETTIGEEKYRVPNSVLNGLKAIIEKMPNLKFFTVLKSGSGMSTKYQVLPLVETPVEEVKA